jgi:hypothetical protein
MDLIERASIAMAGGEDFWRDLSPELRDQYRELARRAQPVLQGGKAVPWDEVAVTLGVVLTEHAGSLTSRKADSDTRQRIVRDQVARLQKSRYTVVYGQPVEGWGILGEGAIKP